MFSTSRTRPSWRRSAVVSATVAVLVAAPTLAPALAQKPPEGRPKGGVPVTTRPTTTSADLAPVVAGNTRFALDVYARLREGDGNRFFSPYSISTALAMTFAGARGDTARQMADTLHFSLPPDKLHPAFHALIDHVNGQQPASGRGYSLLTANALWGQKGDHFLPPFLDLTRDSYDAEFRGVDFRHDAENARLEINAWVEKKTETKIKDLVGPSDLSPDTSLVLTNAIYFKAGWLFPFPTAFTRKDGTFTGPGGKKITVPMMGQKHEFAYHDGGSFQLLELPYESNELSMVVLLPKAAEGLPGLEASLNEADLNQWMGKVSRKQVEVEFPRFSLTESLRLADLLARMGMPLAFDASKADFSGMNGKRDHAISQVIHKAFVDVNEKGTEAAAATGLVMKRSSAMMPTQPVSFKADHPFVFLIREKSTGSLLFLGRVVEPKG